MPLRARSARVRLFCPRPSSNCWRVCFCSFWGKGGRKLWKRPENRESLEKCAKLCKLFLFSFMRSDISFFIHALSWKIMRERAKTYSSKNKTNECLLWLLKKKILLLPFTFAASNFFHSVKFAAEYFSFSQICCGILFIQSNLLRNTFAASNFFHSVKFWRSIDVSWM